MPGTPAVSQRAPRRSRRRQAARHSRHRHAAGGRLHRPSGQGRQRADGRREHSASVARHARPTWTRTASWICSSRTSATFFPEDHNKGAVDLAARARQRQVQRLLARRLAARRRRRGRRLQRRRQERSRRRRVRLAQDRPRRRSWRTAPPTRRSRRSSTHIVDPRTGSIHVIPVDLNHDGKMDFVALLAQEHETVVAYINKGGLRVRAEGHLHRAASELGIVRHPARRSRQGRRSRRPAHARRHVRRRHRQAVSRHPVAREHRARYPFVEHTLAHDARRAPAQRRRSRRRRRPRHRRLRPAGRRLRRGREDAAGAGLARADEAAACSRGTPSRWACPRHATLDVGDIDGDGAPDIVVGNFSINQQMTAWVDVWINQNRKDRKPKSP